jgi:hypothetical protein
MSTTKTRKESKKPEIAEAPRISTTAPAAMVSVEPPPADSSAAAPQAAPYWGDRVAMWIWAISFVALGLLIAGEVFFRQVVRPLQVWFGG